MNEVSPIRDKQVVRDMIEFLREKSERNALLFEMGIYSGLRISDILNLRVRDVKGKEKLYLKERKTGKQTAIEINPELRKDLNRYISDKKSYEVMFPSSRGMNKPITRQQAYHIINEAGRHFGLERIGTHTMRKTFGYHMYQATKDITLVQKLLNHSSPEITLTYIGMTQDRKDAAVRSLRF